MSPVARVRRANIAAPGSSPDRDSVHPDLSGGRHRRRGGGHRAGRSDQSLDTLGAEPERSGDGPGPRRRPDRPERGIWVAAAAISAALLVLPAGSATGLLSPQTGPSAATASTQSGGPTPGTPASVLGASTSPSDTAPVSGGASSASVVAASLTSALPDQRAKIAVEVAMKQIGLPYVWGGNGPENGHRGFDCSGLTTFAYDKAGVKLPRTAHTQFRHGPRIPTGAPLQPGDLVFYGTTAKVRHVGMYIGQGRMVNAPTFGKPVQTAWYRWSGDEYLGATRPAAQDGAAAVPDPAVPAVPDPKIPDEPEFRAPAAPPLPQPVDPHASQPAEADSAAYSHAAALRAAPAAPVPPLRAPIARPEAISPVPTIAAPTPQAPSTAPIRPTTTPPTTVAPTTAAPITPAPVPTPQPPPTPTSSEAPAPTTTMTTPPAPQQAVPTAVVIAGRVVQIRTAPVGADGLPAAANSWANASHWRIRLAENPPVEAGQTIELRYADGTRRVFTVTARTTGTASTVPATAGSLVVVAPRAGSTWHIVTAR